MSLIQRRRLPEDIRLSDIFDIKHIMDIKGSLRIKASGSCMFPNILDNDTLNVKKIKISQIKVGHVVVFKNSDKFVCHRVIEKILRNGEKLVITRADCAKKTKDRPLHEQDIIGRVDSVIRNGRILKPNKKSLLFRTLRKLAKILLKKRMQKR